MSWRTGILSFALASGLYAGFVGVAHAQTLPARVVPPLPAGVVLPPAGAGVAYLASRNLSPNYAEQEYLLSGRANIYGYNAERHLRIEQADHAYTTRILVRYPKDRSKFSGTVIFDVLHPEQGSESMWGFGRDYIVRSGDAYVQVTTSREPRNPLGGTPTTPIMRIKAFDPVRYAGIDYVDSGLTWDIIAQLGRLIKTDSPENPLRDYLPRQTILGGWSGAGALTLFYVNEGFPNRDRMPDGKPIFDAYLVGEPSWYPRVNSSVHPDTDIPLLDPHQQVQPRDVPAISLYSMSFAVGGLDGRPVGYGRFRQDSDAADDRYRLWMVAGAWHGGRNVGLMGGHVQCDHPISDLPLEFYFSRTIDYLKHWSDGTGVPPHAEPLRVAADGSPILDEHGNPTGGVRSATLDVPLGRHFQNAGAPFCAALGGFDAFPAETLRTLYGDHATYVQKVSERVAIMVADGWLLPEDAAQQVREAEAATFPE